VTLGYRVHKIDQCPDMDSFWPPGEKISCVDSTHKCSFRLAVDGTLIVQQLTHSFTALRVTLMS
jgi:hypothetical protein